MKDFEYYTEKYGLSDDPILTLDELLSMDNRVDVIKHMDQDGKCRSLELNDFQEAIKSAKLIPPVPPEVFTVFNGAKRLFVFGYFEYYFLTISLHYLFLAAESALRNRYKAKNGKKEGAFVSLKNIVEALVRDGVIPDSDRHIYEGIVTLRNALSHLTRPTIFPASKRTFERVAAMINQLYDVSTA